MKYKNIKIGTQLFMAFAFIMILVLGMGIFAITKTKQLQMQTEIIYQHPLMVRIAIKDLDIGTLNMRLGMRELLLAKTIEEKNEAIALIDLSEADIERQLLTIEKLYLGPKIDVSTVNLNYILWKENFEKNIELALNGSIEKVRQNLSSDGSLGLDREEMLSGITTIEVFSTNKSFSLYNASKALSIKINQQLVIIVITILLLLLVTGYRIQKNIRTPLSEMNTVVKRFHQGELDVRSTYTNGNEFGDLSASINILVDLVQRNTLLNKKSLELADVMMGEYDLRKFFQETLWTLSFQTNSQMAACYLLNEAENRFDYFESIGMNQDSKRSFDADHYEGIFGSVLISQKVQVIQNIPKDAFVKFNTVNGQFVPHEIITIPIISGSHVIAIITLATINAFERDAIPYIDSILVALGTRIEGVLAYRLIKNYKEALEEQNKELIMNKTELSAQTAELTQQNIELEMQKKQLNESSQLKTNFLSNMSHELRTPLNSVIALSGVLNRRLINRIPEEEYSYLEVIERNGKNLLMLINDILDISRIEAGREEIELIDFNMVNLVDDVVALIKPQTMQNNIDLSHSSELEKVMIHSDVEKCRHILQNLIGNAVKFTEKGQVEITTKLTDSHLSISVVDSGIGISPQQLPHIFDEFRQGDGSTSRKFHGTGLGLAIAKKYANLLGGSITVDSIPDKGSEFTLVLPRNFDEALTISDSNGKTILLVEDNESAIIQVKDLIDEMGYHVIVAQNGKIALEIIKTVVPDAMILDLMMPEIDGFQLLETIRNEDATALVPVLILTAKHITKDDLAILKRNNIHQLIQKGDVDRVNLQNSIATMLKKGSHASALPKLETRSTESKRVILIVEDNPDNMTTVKALLSDKYTVLGAGDGIEGIRMATENIPDLILMDIALPGKNGIEAFKEIRKSSQLKHIPIIALTASAMLQDREAILSHGFDAFIAKPIISKQFFEVIDEVLYGDE